MNQVSHALTIGSERAKGGSVASIHVGPDDKEIVMCGSETILAASLREGIPHAYACGGRARCSICRISVEGGLEFCRPRSKGERIVAERLNFSPETRLACQTKITGDVNVRRLVVDDDDIEFTRGIAEGPRPAEIAADKAEIERLETEYKQAVGDAKAKLKVKVDTARKRYEDRRELLLKRIEEIQREGEAKITLLQEQMAKATGQAKANLEKRVTDERTKHNARLAKLRQAWQLVKEAAAI
jgi:ferredoxin